MLLFEDSEEEALRALADGSCVQDVAEPERTRSRKPPGSLSVSNWLARRLMAGLRTLDTSRAFWSGAEGSVSFRETGPFSVCGFGGIQDFFVSIRAVRVQASRERSAAGTPQLNHRPTSEAELFP